MLRKIQCKNILFFSEITAKFFLKSFTLSSCKCRWIQNFEFYCALLFLDFQIKDLASAASCASTNVRATYLEFVLGVQAHYMQYLPTFNSRKSRKKRRKKIKGVKKEGALSALLTNYCRIHENAILLFLMDVHSSELYQALMLDEIVWQKASLSTFLKHDNPQLIFQVFP